MKKKVSLFMLVFLCLFGIESKCYCAEEDIPRIYSSEIRNLNVDKLKIEFSMEAF